MRRFFVGVFLAWSAPVMAAENLIDTFIIRQNVTIDDGIIYQVDADEREFLQWKVQVWFANANHIINGDRSYEQRVTWNSSAIGWQSVTFTTPSDMDDFLYFRFGINGRSIDTTVTFKAKDVAPSTTYTLQWRVLNATQGSIAWTDMFMVHCADGYSLEPGDDNCSHACDNMSVAGGFIPANASRVYEPEICVYDPSHIVCNDGYSKIENTCEQICTAGIRHLHVGDMVNNLYNRKRSTPALHIEYNGHVCYGYLAPGTGGGVNINLNGAIYHLID